ncbi:aly/REF export factor 2-like [Aethina tumida]|uniref:aly/REF export factor 2-like n=1 Tax=Aethina tumida TaxID=116153 RepID=UPI00096B2B1E|nr:aly/REF export factor 2-like [Aethina tumida]
MSLDEIIKSSKPLAENRNRNRNQRRSHPYKQNNRSRNNFQTKPQSTTSENGGYNRRIHQRKSFPETSNRIQRPNVFQRNSDGFKMLVSNLHPSVTNMDLQELFIEFGDLKRWSIHYNQNGKSVGTGEVVFFNRDAATRAVRQYNGVPLDGRPMRLELVGERNDNAPRFLRNWGNNKEKEQSFEKRRVNGPKNEVRKNKAVTEEDLDAEMEEYNRQRTLSGKE